MRTVTLFFALFFLLLLASVLSLSLGPVSISVPELWRSLWSPQSATGVHDLILWQMRIPRTLTAILAGAGLSVAGLLMQTVFRNVLAGPYVLGVSSGASMGVALVLLMGVGAGGAIGILGAATFGALGVLALVLWLASFCRTPVSLLILGLMMGYLVDSCISLLIHFGDPDRLALFVNWGFGSFGRVHWGDFPVLAGAVLVGLLLALPSLKYLNTVLLGEQVAQSLGVSVRTHRILVLGAASLLTAVCTVYCGPIGFIGLAVPHLVRALFRTANHRILLPACALAGASLSVLAGWVANLPTHGGVLPLNAVTALVGVPVVFWALLRGHGRMDG